MKSLIQATTTIIQSSKDTKASQNLKRNYPEAFSGNAQSLTDQKLENARKMKKLKKTVFLSFPKGHQFNTNDYQHIMHIYYRLTTHKDFKNLVLSNAYELTALLFGCTKETVQKVIEAEGQLSDGRYNKWMGEKEISLEYKDIFANEIRSGLKRGVRLSSKYFRDYLVSEGIDVSRKTVIRKMKEWGLEWGALKERDIRRRNKSVLKKREEYLQELIQCENDGFVNRIYYDESYINQNYSLSTGWFIKEESREIYKPSGAGGRIAMMAALENNSWAGAHPHHVKRCLAIERDDGFHSYKSIKYWPINKDTENAGNVDKNIFLDYFETYLLPNLPPKSLIIIDNARYHLTYNANVFILKSSLIKGEIRAFLESKGEVVEDHETKVDLLARAKRIYKKPKCQAELLAEAQGHRLVFLPPYHPELNAIEYAWAYVKRTAAEISPYKIKTLCDEVLPLAYSLVTSDAINKLFEHVKNEENRYRNSLEQEKALIESQPPSMETEEETRDYNDSDKGTDCDDDFDDLDDL